MVEVRALPDLSSLIVSFISLLLSIGIIALGIYFFIKVLSATKDIRKIKEDMGKIVELLEKRKD